jgi:S1-C subfamily serine protease
MKFLPTLLAGLLGGGIVAAALLLTGVVGDGETKTVVEQTPLQQPSNQNSSPSSGGDKQGLTPKEIYERDAPGVVFVRANVVRQSESPFDLFPQQEQGQSTGSGFFVDKEGYILTNAHVVEGAQRVTIQAGEDDEVEAKIVGRDASNDLALLKVDPKQTKVTPLPLGNSDDVEVGDATVAIGNPFGLDRTLTTGVVSAIQRQITAPNGFQISDVIQTDAAINPGNSGGPLFDSAGKVIGINSQIATGGGGGGNVGIGFAVPINTAKDALQSLKTTGTVKHGFLGITGVAITKQMSDTLKVGSDRGVLVQTVTPGGPAAKAGLKGGHSQVEIDGAQILLGGSIILKIDGKEVEDFEDVTNAVNAKKAGDKIELEVRQPDGKVEKKTITLGERPDQASGGQDPD